MKELSVPPTDADRVMGSLDAPLVVVEYGDFDCPHTRRAHGILKQLMQMEPRMALVFRAFPLRHMHENAERLAEVMYAIDDPQKYWAAHERLMGIRHMSLPAAEEGLREIGLDLHALRGKHHDAALRVQADVDRGQQDGVHSTPSFFFNGAPHDGHYDLDTLRQLASDALHRG